MTKKLSDLATRLIASLGYLGLGIGLVLNAAGVPIPSEVLLPLAGASARQGRFSLAAVIILATLAQTLGASISYWIGAWGGEPLVRRYGKYVLFRENELKKTQALFARWGSWLMFVGYLLPGVHSYVGYPAGLSRMPFGRFLASTLAGTLVWTVLLVELGYQLGGRLDQIDHFISRFGIIVLLLALAGLIWYLVMSNRRKKA